MILPGSNGSNIDVLNPPFDSRIFNVSFLESDGSKSGLARGQIIESTDSASRHGGTKYLINFLYNPSTISISYGIFGNAPPNPDTTVDVVKGNIVGYSMGSLSFSLLFDRTYEKWDSKYRGTDAGIVGVGVDVGAFRRLVGLLDPSASGGIKAPWQADNSVMQQNLCYFHFGGPHSLLYFGYISSLDVQYTHWTQDMTPVRAVISIQVATYPENTTLSSGSGSNNNNNNNGSGDGGGVVPIPNSGGGAVSPIPNSGGGSVIPAAFINPSAGISGR